jgi:tellurite resistance protein TerC
METPIISWIIFNAFVLMMLALDLGVFHRKSHEVSVKEAFTWTLIWVFLALIFNAIIFLEGTAAGIGVFYRVSG